jgi:hypothetical protein
VPNWFVDGLNSTGCASDTNSCTTSACGATGAGPCSTYHEIQDHRWGCMGAPAACPRLQQNTIIRLLSSQQPTDWIYLHAALENSSFVAIAGSVPSGTSLTLAGVVALNRATPQLWNANLGASVIVGAQLVNQTHPSTAWTHSLIAGTTYSLSNPVTTLTIPFTFLPASVAWSNGDVVTVTPLPDALIADFSPISANTSGVGYIATVNVNRASAAPTNLGGSASILAMQSAFGGDIVQSDQAFGGYDFVNCSFYGSTIQSFQINQVGGAIGLFAGQIQSTVSPFNCVSCGPDFDVIFGTGSDGSFPGTGNMYLDTGVTATMHATGFANSIGLTADTGGGNAVIWGPGSLGLGDTARFVYPSGAGKAVAAFKNTGGLLVNGLTKGCLGVPGAASAYGTCNITVNPTNLDADLGATIGCVGVPNGAAFCNEGF